MTRVFAANSETSPLQQGRAPTGIVNFCSWTRLAQEVLPAAMEARPNERVIGFTVTDAGLFIHFEYKD
jgi:hypothetical protein